jgi:hypothetical protein
LTCRVRKLIRHAARAYSWISPPSRSQARLGYRCGEPERAVWPVVVVDVDAQDALELLVTADREPIEAVAADGADPAFGERVCFRRAKGVRMISTPSLRKTSSKTRLNLLSRGSGTGPVSLARRVTTRAAGLAGLSRARPASRHPPSPHPPLPTTNKRQSRALHPHPPERLGLRRDLRLKPTTQPSP